MRRTYIHTQTNLPSVIQSRLKLTRGPPRTRNMVKEQHAAVVRLVPSGPRSAHLLLCQSLLLQLDSPLRQSPRTVNALLRLVDGKEDGACQACEQQLGVRHGQ